MIEKLAAQLRRDEGQRPLAYQDHLGFLTIGVGRLIDSRKPGAGLRPDEIDYLLRNDINDRVAALQKSLPWFVKLDEARQGVLINMAFQMGTAGLLAFRQTLAMVRDGKYAEAADQMLKSKWAEQTPARAKRLSEQMKTGEWK
jgi:lysozyme